MAKFDKTNPTGVTKIEPDKVLVLLEELIEIGKDTDYQEYLVSINERILDSQERTEKIGKEITKLIKDFEPIAAPIESSPLNSIIKDMELIMDSYMEKTGESIKELIEFLRENEKTPQIVEALQEKEGKEEQADILEDFLSQNEDQIQQNIDGMKEEEKKKFKDYDLVKKALGVVTKVTDMMAKPVENISDQAIANLIGPLQLVTQPLEDFFNINLVDSIKENMKTGFSKVSSFLFKKKDDESPISIKDKEEEDRTASFLEQRIQPSKRDLLNAGVLGASAVYLADTFKDALMPGDKSESLLGEGANPLDGMSSMVPEAVTKAVPGLLKGIGTASLVGGILWGVFDGILAAGKAEEWGVSKITASVAGFFGGTGEGGDIKKAFANAGKFALTGVGIGTPFGPLGMLAGGLGGAVLGGILGWIGGENIAEFFQGVGEWFKGIFVNVKDWIGENKEDIKAVKESVVGIITPLFGQIIDGVKAVFSGITTRFTNIKDILGNDEMSLWEKITAIGKEVIWGIIEVPYNFVKGGLASFFGDRWKTMSDIAGDKETSIWEKIGGIGKEILSGIVDKMVGFVSGALGLADNVIKLILNDEWEAKYETLKTNIKEVFGFIFTPIIDGVKEFFSGWKERFGNIKEIFGDDDITLWEKIKAVGAELLGGIWDGFKSLFGGAIESVKNYFTTVLTGMDTFIPKLLGEGGEEKWESFKTSVKDWFGLIFDPFVGGIKNFFAGWKDKLSNISEIAGDDELSPWEKIKGTAKELLMGVIEGPINLVKGWIDGLKNNEKFVEIKNKMTGWFTNIGKAVSEWIWGILPDWTQDALRKLGIGPEGAKTEAGVEISNKVMSKLESGEISQEQLEGAANKDFIEGILNNGLLTNRKKLSNLLNFEPSKKILSQVGITSQEDVDNLNSWLGEPSGKVNEFKNLLESIPVEQVKDAIIYKDGKLIQPHPDDNIIATKESPFVVEKKETEKLHNEIENNYFKESKDSESQKKFDTMISILQVIADKIQSGGNVSVIENSSASGFDFNQLRIGTSR